MYAIIETSGKQYRVQPGDVLCTELLKSQVGEQIKFDKVLLVGGLKDEKTLVGRPYVANAAIEGEVIDHGRGEKLLIIKYRRRKGFRKTQGHRQAFTKVLITKLTDGSGSEVKFDLSKRNEILMKNSIKTSQKSAKPVAKAAAPETKAKKTKATKKEA